MGERTSHGGGGGRRIGAVAAAEGIDLWIRDRDGFRSSHRPWLPLSRVSLSLSPRKTKSQHRRWRRRKAKAGLKQTVKRLQRSTPTAPGV
ncbi:uncharacterized protein G2W53_011771 [Senna tora]|uniref:Uncharacterized protein n=1 Tax=Senna tora TaxID=362788 RepID=A0A834TVR5_9FABA|nr:uncharacterized protein G2W53_011771 [Senna tora]